MALVIGTNCGFVTVAPDDSDPEGASSSADTRTNAIPDTTPAGVSVITEIGWWCVNETEAADFEVGIYTDNGSGTEPLNLVGKSSPVAKGTTLGWKRVTGLSIPISPETLYWIAFQVDDTVTTTNMDRGASASGLYCYMSSQTEIAATWSNASGGTRTLAVYAVVGGAPPVSNRILNII